MTDWVKGVVSGCSHWTNNLFSLRIEAEVSPFKAGQYTWLAPGSLDEIGLEKSAQPYSILSAPGDQALEFFFYTRTEGDLSKQLSRFNEGDQLWVKRAAEGTLTLSQLKDAETLCLLATGTGVAPFLSMLKTSEPWQRFQKVVLVYAVRYNQDLRYQELFDDLQQRYPGRFQLIAFVSREVPSSRLMPFAIQGHIPESLQNGTLEALLDIEFSPLNTQFMLCGNPGMVKDAVSVLQQRGFSDNKPAMSGELSYEAYW
ncbi:MAG: ferredoxin--NADP reductase [Pseudohongiella sp.]|nr:ferredoxin--NADP reductase [Pseudohongiella sp.]